VKEDEPAYPIDVSILGADAVVADAAGFAHLVEKTIGPNPTRYSRST
jgi:hypothetical protein